MRSPSRRWDTPRRSGSFTAAGPDCTTSSASRAISGPPSWGYACSNANPEPQFKGYEYLLEKYLKPRPRTDILDALAEEGIVPTAMIDLTDGLAGDLMQLCKASSCGARIYLERIPIAQQTSALCEEMHADPVVAALNGGEDYELLFTVPLSMQEQVMRLGLVDVIGHITPDPTGCFLVTPDGQEIALKAQGFPEK